MFDIIKLVNKRTGFETFVRHDNYPGWHTPLEEARIRQKRSKDGLDIYYKTPGPTNTTRWSHKPIWTKLHD